MLAYNEDAWVLISWSGIRLEPRDHHGELGPAAVFRTCEDAEAFLVAASLEKPVTLEHGFVPAQIGDLDESTRRLAKRYWPGRYYGEERVL